MRQRSRLETKTDLGHLLDLRRNGHIAPVHRQNAQMLFVLSYSALRTPSNYELHKKKARMVLYHYKCLIFPLCSPIRLELMF
jgi:hypothetical protein